MIILTTLALSYFFGPWLSLAILCLPAVLWLESRRDFPKLNGKFSQKFGLLYGTKYAISVVLLSFFSLLQRHERQKNPKLEIEADKLNGHIDDENSINECKFYGSDKNGSCLVIGLTRMAGDNIKVALRLRLGDGRLLTHNEVVVDETPDQMQLESSFMAGGGLRIRQVRPMTTFRVLYAGRMELLDESGMEKVVEVNLRLWCRSLADPAHSFIDCHPSLLAQAIAVERWSKRNLKEIRNLVFRGATNFEQATEFRGRLQIFNFGNEEAENNSVELTLYGIRHRFVGKAAKGDIGCFYRARFENGFILSLKATSNSDLLTHRLEGFLHHPTGFVYPISWSDFHLSRLLTTGIPDSYKINFMVNRKWHSLSVDVLQTDCPSKCSLSNCNFTLDGKTSGYGVVEFRQKHTHDVLPSSDVGEKSLVHWNKNRQSVVRDLSYCLSLNEKTCASTSISGGKASQLAVLMASAGYQNADYQIPPGFAVTVEAYHRQFARQEQINNSINDLMDAVKSSDSDSRGKASPEALKEACDDLVAKILELPMDDTVRRDIQNCFEKLFGDERANRAVFAVRSSAVGEDSAEASGAGQMETFLGVSGIDDIIESVKKCWASHFAFRAVEYRRQLGARIDSPMAVLVQQIVPAHVAGVLFTRHPDTGSSARCLINASFGIGESVVSGTVDVDTISVFKYDTNAEDVKIRVDHVGKKSTALEATNNGLVSKRQTDMSTNGLCLSECDIKRLVKIGLSIEGVFGGGRDVEFAAVQNDSQLSFYVLQARPITTADMEEEWEMMQEFDTPIASYRELLTTANVQEVMPGTLSPLSNDLWVGSVSFAMEDNAVRLGIKPKRRFPVCRGAQMSSQHPFLNLTMLYASLSSKEASDVALFGRVLHELSMESVHEQNGTESKWLRLYCELKQWISRLRIYRPMEVLEDTIENMTTPSSNEMDELFEEVRSLYDLGSQSVAAHVQVSSASSIGSAIMTIILEKDPKKWDNKIYADVAVMLSSCKNVLSAEIPARLEEIARAIGKDEEMLARFLSMERRTAANWLKSSQSESGQVFRLFDEFLQKHGHRCVREGELREKSWSQEPEKVVDALQAMLESGSLSSPASKPMLSVEEAINSIKTPISNTQRFFLRKLLPIVRKAVGRREWSKSLSIKFFNHVRLGFAKLAQLLEENGHLPDSDLMYFLSEPEVSQLVKSRSPKLVAKANRRRKLLEKLDALKFEEINFGHPKAISDDVEETARNGDVEIVGTPVGQGCISGTARVVTSLAQAKSIKKGEVLVVAYTDIGWSPYFPLIKGLITEIGGIVSHGAVIAREYGLPCIIGCKKATKIVQTGDYVYIDGRSGKVSITKNA